MQAKDFMTTGVVTVTPDTTVEDVAKLLLEKRVSAVPVVDTNGKILGIVSEGDLMRRPETGTEPHHSWWLGLLSSSEDRASEFLKTHGLTAGDAMTKDVFTVGPGATAGEIAEKLARRHIKRVPVVDGDKLIGIVSRANLINALAVHKHVMPKTSVDDETIRKNILDYLKKEGLDGLGMINPIVSDGVVHLWGTAESEEERKAVRVAVESIEGVKSVESNVGLLTGMTRAVMWAE